MPCRWQTKPKRTIRSPSPQRRSMRNWATSKCCSARYQGFAKQNYTMLDNLKLGYGGTKSEMERLLADAEAISGIHYDLESYADVVDAIHVIQTSMDITGTTAKEAEHTISGSINALQAAGKNLLVGFGNADADMEQLCGNMAEALKTSSPTLHPSLRIS